MGVILLVRHGQASFGGADYDVLSPMGEHQARRLGTALAEQGVQPATIIAGSMQRQRSSAAALVEQAGWALEMSIDPAWVEYDPDQMITGHANPQATLTRGEYQEALEAGLRRWVGATGQPTAGESFAAFADRTASALRDVAAKQPRGATDLVMTSGGVIGWIAASLLGGGVEQWIRLNRVTVNTGVTKLVTGRQGISLVTFNEHAHLTREETTYR